MNAANLLRWYRLVFAGLIVAGSALTLARPEHHAILLALVEIVGAFLFLWRRSQYVGAAILLGVFAVAELASIEQGQLPTHLLQYAAAVVFVIALDHCLSRPRAP